MYKPKAIKEFRRIAADYGKASYQLYESSELLKRQKKSLQNLQKWAKDEERKKVSAHSLEMLMAEIIQTRQRIWSETKFAKYLRKQVASLEHALQIQTRKLMASE